MKGRAHTDTSLVHLGAKQAAQVCSMFQLKNVISEECCTLYDYNVIFLSKCMACMQ